MTPRNDPGYTQLYGYINGTVKAPPMEIDGEEANTKVSSPAYEAWMAQD
jgi:hypothetical protein